MPVGGDLTSIPGLYLPFARGWPLGTGRDRNSVGEWQQSAYAYRDVVSSNSTAGPTPGVGGRHILFPRANGPRKYGPRR